MSRVMGSFALPRKEIGKLGFESNTQEGLFNMLGSRFGTLSKDLRILCEVFVLSYALLNLSMRIEIICLRSRLSCISLARVRIK